ncbi:phage related protein (plasmid) [Selenomonas ruminantium subsp. lactilytica TAM6421]|uniref:Phage related protein n=1 Tax=Selenomonas ruminantium subsp. lactilytica (strain NBRC 103574 / TAM6421) TaxID=927704 RepID=I0GWR6_SELRL|nr:phage tail tube protein [Selenomonas ruminantium]BAL85203.1 phage related protein [Selenomonas ruminantium subsp. lactilytica TAM6421]
MENMESKRVFYGTYGQMWLDGELLGEVEELKATVKLDKIEVKMSRHLGKCYKSVGWTGSGSFKLHKVSSFMIEKLAPHMKEGKQVLVTIVSKMSDPDAIGTERVVLRNCQIDSVDLINWKLGALSEESYNFTFEDYDILESADA